MTPDSKPTQNRRDFLKDLSAVSLAAASLAALPTSAHAADADQGLQPANNQLPPLDKMLMQNDWNILETAFFTNWAASVMASANLLFGVILEESNITTRWIAHPRGELTEDGGMKIRVRLIADGVPAIIEEGLFRLSPAMTSARKGYTAKQDFWTGMKAAAAFSLYKCFSTTPTEHSTQLVPLGEERGIYFNHDALPAEDFTLSMGLWYAQRTMGFLPTLLVRGGHDFWYQGMSLHLEATTGDKSSNPSESN